MPRLLSPTGATLLAVVMAAGAVAAAAPRGAASRHLDRTQLSRRCGSCHVGHGLARTPMLTSRAERLCLRCHGGSANREQMVRQGRLAATARPVDVEQEFKKPYRHPIERASLHRTREGLGSRGAATPRHAACADCHDPHRAPPRQPPSLLGTRVRRSPLPGAATEAELCFRCHGPSAAKVVRARDVSRQFALGNASSHAVLAPGVARHVPSLLLPWTATSVLACGDCHGSDDPSAPRGPHGSTHQYLLRERYSTQPGTVESQAAYALCYRCHSRRSILGNESFRHHSRHVLGAGGRGGVPCRACHSAHGSQRHPGLIEFDTSVAFPTRFGRLQYRPAGAAGGTCRLVCHGVEHPRDARLDPATQVPSPRLPLGPGLGDSTTITPLHRPKVPPAASPPRRP